MPPQPPRREKTPEKELRIIGGQFRGRRIRYSGDPRTRPMKDRVREAMFNLVGPRIKGAHAIDLFAGTGAIGLEALSRGAKRATFVERHFPTAALLKQNAESLGVADRCQVASADVFFWAGQQPDLGEAPCVVFISPPFAFYEERFAEMLRLIEALAARAPGGSLLVVEADQRLDFSHLPRPDAWDVRAYPPACIGLCELP